MFQKVCVDIRVRRSSRYKIGGGEQRRAMIIIL